MSLQIGSGGGLLTVATPPGGTTVLATTTNLPLASNTPPSLQSNAFGLSQQHSIISQSASTKNTAKVDANIVATRPLFDKTNTTLIKLRRDIKMQKLKGWPTYKFDLIRSTLPVQPENNFGLDDWLPNDDFIILHV
jgi:hypothetical protein